MIQNAIPVLDKKGLQRFGLQFSALTALLFGLALPYVLGHTLPLWPWFVALLFALWSMALPSSLAPFYRLWMQLGLLLGRITTPVILSLLYIGIIVPTGLLMRIFSQDPLAKLLDPSADSYKIRREPQDKAERKAGFEAPF